ncbi:MAG: aspartate 1-decarboxylase [Planctomycetes bacterium]|nr:aspartate 1-decarboxylase [Planctomycetota bacterium]
MYRSFLRAKIHHATVTDANLNYAGSITIDRNLMDAVGLAEWECVLVADLTNGTRHETYVIPGERGSGTICINGAAAHLVNVGDKVIIMCFAMMDEAELSKHRAQVIVLDEKNRLVRELK